MLVLSFGAYEVQKIVVILEIFFRFNVLSVCYDETKTMVRRLQFLMWLFCAGTSAKSHQVPTAVGTPVQSDTTSSRES